MKKVDKTCEISVALPLTETNLFAHLLQVCFRRLPVSKFEQIEAVTSKQLRGSNYAEELMNGYLITS